MTTVPPRFGCCVIDRKFSVYSYGVTRRRWFAAKRSAYRRTDGDAKNSKSLFRETQIARAQLEPASGPAIGIEVGSDVIGVRNALSGALEVVLGVAR